MQLEDAQSALSSKKLSKAEDKNLVVNGPEIVDMQSKFEIFLEKKYFFFSCVF